MRWNGAVWHAAISSVGQVGERLTAPTGWAVTIPGRAASALGDSDFLRQLRWAIRR